MDTATVKPDIIEKIRNTVLKAAFVLTAAVLLSMSGREAMAVHAAASGDPAWTMQDVYLLSAPDGGSDVLAVVQEYTQITYLGASDGTFWNVSVNGTQGYIDCNYCTLESGVMEAYRSATEAAQAEAAAQVSAPSGLTKYKGVVYGPSGKETYYNLNMSRIVDIMHASGISGDYWVRDDGCKMLGNYIMVAADLSVHPRGSLVETSLGTAMVCDTGAFAGGSVQLDVATAW
jgi:hypothetical protein